MKTLTKLVKAEMMTQTGYELGDFTLKFNCFFAENDKSNRRSNSVFASFHVYTLDGVFEFTHSFKIFDFGFVTPSGYKSTKLVPVRISSLENLTSSEVAELKQYSCVYKLNTFDPFYAENEAKRRNASAWNYIAANYITDPYCTR